MRVLTLDETKTVNGGLYIEAGLGGVIASFTAGFFEVDFSYVTLGTIALTILTVEVIPLEERFCQSTLDINTIARLLVTYPALIVATIAYNIGFNFRALTKNLVN